MKKLVRFSLGLAALLSLSSCALPPREAWRIIRHDGLLPYVAVELGHRPVPRYVHLPPASGSRFIAVTSSPKAPLAVKPGTSGPGPIYVKRAPGLIAGNRFLDTSPAVAAKPKPPLAPVPAPVAPPKPAVASDTAKPAPVAKPKPSPAIADTPKPKPAPTKPKKEAEETPKVVVKPKPPVESKPQPKLPPNPVPVPNPDRVVSKPTPPAERGGTLELPFGTPIAGRPGLVNSPFAGRNQLVDVTGLAPGQEVKCPYSGKLFRVPGVQEAKADTKPALDAPPSKPKEKEGAPKP